MKRKLVVALLIGTMMAMSARAEEEEINTYQNDYVQFSYPITERFLNISKYYMGYSNLYIISTQEYYDIEDYSCVYISVSEDVPYGHEFMYDADTGEPQLREGTKPAEQHEIYKGEQCYMVKELFTYGDDPDGYQLCEDIYSSVEPSATFGNKGPEEQQDEFVENIYCNYKYSERMLAYAKQAITVCDQFLSGSITADELNIKLDSLHDSAREYERNSNYPCDFDIVLALNYNHYKADGEVMDLKFELEEFFK